MPASKTDPKLDEVKAVLRRLQHLTPETVSGMVRSNEERPTVADRKSPSSERLTTPQHHEAARFPVAVPGLAEHLTSSARQIGQSQLAEAQRSAGKIRVAAAFVATLAVAGGAGAAWLLRSHDHAPQTIASFPTLNSSIPDASRESAGALVGSPPIVALPKDAEPSGSKAARLSALHATPGDSASKVEAQPPEPTPATPVSLGILSDANTLIAAGRILDARRLLSAVENAPSDIALLLARTYDPTVLASLQTNDAEPDPQRAAYWYRVWNTRAQAEGMLNDGRALDRLLRSLDQVEKR